VQEPITAAIEVKGIKRKASKPSVNGIYVTENVSRRRAKFAFTLLSWRYGLKERVDNADSADIIVVNSDPKKNGQVMSLRARLSCQPTISGLCARLPMNISLSALLRERL